MGQARGLAEGPPQFKELPPLSRPRRVYTERHSGKNFNLPLAEKMKVQFRSEFFNVLNRVNLSNQVSGEKMGRITSAGGPRVLQFALKLLF